MANDEKLTQEELAAEQEATKEVNETEVRQHVIDEYGFDETADTDKIEKATKKEVEHRKKLSQAIGQKIKYRDQAAGGKKEEVPAPKTTADVNKDGSDMSFTDQRALINSQIHDDDIQEVKDYANLKKISIADALKAPVIVATLKENDEKRQTANATNVGPARRGPTRQTDDDLIHSANSGKLPESESDIDRLMEAKFNKKKAEIKSK